MTEQQVTTPERPSRYNRSVGGLVVALIVTVLFVGAYVGFRALTREQPNGLPDRVDYVQPVRDLQQVHVSVVYPHLLPKGWTSTSVDYDRGEHPGWGIGFVTEDDRFVGIRQQDQDVAKLLQTYVDDHPNPGADATVPSEFGDTWQTWSDSGGDHAFATTLSSGADAGETLLVYGSASVEEQEELIALLTTDPLPPRS